MATHRPRALSVESLHYDVDLEAGKNAMQTMQTIVKFFSEFLATYILILAGCGSEYVNAASPIGVVGVAIAWGAAATAVVYTFHISGPHLNPAVTLGLAIVGKFPWKQVPHYALAQVLAGIVAIGTLRWFFQDLEANVVINSPVGDTSDFKACFCEIVITFILQITIMGTVCDERAAKGLAGVAIGAAVVFDVIIGWSLSGASLNPARSFAPALIASDFRKLWIYVLGPTIGAVAASLFYNLLSQQTPPPAAALAPPHHSSKVNWEATQRNPAYTMSPNSELNDAE